MSEETRIAYYQQADSWARQRDTTYVRSARRAWIVAGVAVGIAGLSRGLTTGTGLAAVHVCRARDMRLCLMKRLELLAFPG